MLGLDIIEIERIERAAKNPRFIAKVFTPYEIEYYESKGSKAQTLAGIFCAKEAALKAAGTGFGKIKFTDAEVKHRDIGQPYLICHNTLKELFDGYEVDLSITHCMTYAAAVVTAIKK